MRITAFGILIILFFFIKYLHIYILSSMGLTPGFSLTSVYMFHAIAAFIIYAAVEFTFLKLPSQAGVGFLVGITIKIGLFLIVFQEEFSSVNEMALFERMALLIPMFLFLLLESIGLGRLLNNS